MKQKKYLALYKKWSKTGKLPKEGLCESLGNDVELELFTPTAEEYGSSLPARYFHWGYNGVYGTIGPDVSRDDIDRDFTPLRQTILLFMAAMNGEL